ncbi:MAG: hypothetical protein AUK34_05420 [Ignavibacteria bacterium CG2_30_36_16]|nr:hypothetical protein [Ignavibacteria bacterium]OIP61145.1 MAG: hypothetical protein AUK34_05420 [Ignavibacteria bacterium CG2_30_36_16]PJB01695.1 MAG: hypothetical protein CO127_02540 [Ignavibacteria bacterium CG_4_9_14_3_um_filter_36_18]
MNKIILQFGLLVFFLAVIFFSQRGIPLQDILLKSFLIFIVLTVMLSIAAIVFMKSINKSSLDKSKELTENLTGSSK